MDKKEEEKRKEEQKRRKRGRKIVNEEGEKTPCLMQNVRSLDGDELEGLRVACRLGREVSP